MNNSILPIYIILGTIILLIVQDPRAPVINGNFDLSTINTICGIWRSV